MADQLNGAPNAPRPSSGIGPDGGHGGGGALRVTFAAGTRPGPSGEAAAGEAAAGEAAAGEASARVAPTIETDVDGHVIVDGRRLAATLREVRPPRARLVVDTDEGSREHDVLVLSLPDPARSAAGVRRVEIVIDGWRFELDVDSERRARLRERATSARTAATKGEPAELRAIIPGRVVSVDVAEGDKVEPGRRLLVLEAMKMQNEVKAPRVGTVARVAVGPGQTVELGDLLLVIE